MATIKGKWVFNESVSGDITETINFTTETPPPSGDKWVAIYCYYDDDDGEREVRFGYSYNGGVSQFPVYGDGWSLQVYRTIDFGTAEQTVSDTFLTWMQANAVQQAEPITTTITYNNTEIASLAEGQSATVPAGKKATSDISIVFGAKGSITYNGQTTEVEAGKTATLACAGKKFATDVVVAVEKAIELITFIIDGTSYQAESGMTWGEWVPSKYNTNGVKIDSGGSVLNSTGLRIGTGAFVGAQDSTDTIVANTSYVIQQGGGVD